MALPTTVTVEDLFESPLRAGATISPDRTGAWVGPTDEVHT